MGVELVNADEVGLDSFCGVGVTGKRAEERVGSKVVDGVRGDFDAGALDNAYA